MHCDINEKLSGLIATARLQCKFRGAKCPRDPSPERWVVFKSSRVTSEWQQDARRQNGRTRQQNYAIMLLQSTQHAQHRVLTSL